MDPLLILILFVMLVIFAAAIFCIGLVFWLALKVIFSGLSLSERKRATTIIEPQPEAHGDGAWIAERAAYPEGFR